LSLYTKQELITKEGSSQQTCSARYSHTMEPEDTWMFGQNSIREEEHGFGCHGCLRLTSTVALIVTTQNTLRFLFNPG